MKTILCLVLPILLLSCNNQDDRSDAYGNFETIETIISSQVQGEIKYLVVEKGMTFEPGQVVGIIDSTACYLQLRQLIAQRKAVESKINNILSESEVQEEQRANLEIEQRRIEKLLKDSAATHKQMDDVMGQLRLVDSRIKAIKTQNSAVLNEIEALSSQIELAKDQLDKCKIVNPVQGTILEKYAEPYELALPGKALYKIADLSELDLRVYVSGDQLADIGIGDKVKVLFDKDKKSNESVSGTVRWISANAEFTPKIIQTKKERVNMVYAVLIRVKNNGTLKVGMPGEVQFID